MKTINLVFLVIFTLICNFSFSQSLLSGKVVDEFGKPIYGATIRFKGINDFVATTDKKGSFTITAPSDTLTIIATADGMQNLEQKFKNSKNLVLKMTEIVFEIPVIVDSLVVEEVIVESLEYEMSVEAFGESRSLDYDKVSKGEAKKEKSSSRDWSLGARSAPKSAYYYESVEGISTSSTESYDGDYKISDDFKTGELTDDKREDANVKSGLLTAGEIHDFSKWELWNDITSNQLSEFKSLWEIYPLNRYCVQLTSKDGKPLINKKVELRNSKNEVIWNSVTDNTGKAELWAAMFDSTKTDNSYSINLIENNKSYEIKDPKKFHDGINILSIENQCNIPNIVDIAFVVDATGSMSDEIEYLKAELLDIMQKAGKKHTDLIFNLGSVFYRDYGDAYLTKISDLTTKLDSSVNFIKQQYAGGGGDFPEAVEAGLDAAINNMKWSEKAIAKMLFLVLDAPPHNNSEVKEKLEKVTIEAAKKGIRIIPITCSGIDKSTEYLMRSIALATNGTYVFLTDDSGIGDSHIAPTTDEYKVEYLNDLIIRLIDQYTLTPTCDNQLVYNPETLNDTTFLVIENIEPIVDINISETDTNKTNNDLNNLLINNNNNQNVDTNNVDNTNNITDLTYDYSKGIKFYPNPTVDIVNIEFIGDIKEIYIADNSGKLLERFKIEDEDKIQINLGNYPSGMYFIQYLNKDQWKSGKIILMRK